MTKLLEHNMVYFTRVYNNLTECTSSIYKVATEVTKIIMEQAIAMHDKENKEKTSTKTVKMYTAFQEKLCEVVYENNTFLDYIYTCVSCLASEREHKMTKHLNNMCRRTIDLLHVLGNF